MPLRSKIQDLTPKSFANFTELHIINDIRGRGLWVGPKINGQAHHKGFACLGFAVSFVTFFLGNLHKMFIWAKLIIHSKPFT